MEAIINSLKAKIKDADLVLVGIGEEFSVELSELAEYKKYVENNDSKENGKWMLPYIEKICLRDYDKKKIEDAYHILCKLLENKNYYIVSTCMDDYIFDTDFKKDRIVAPCGGYRLEQCADNCENRVWDADNEYLTEIYEYLDKGNTTTKIKKPVCDKCGSNIVFNNVETDNYEEKGYLEQWNKYTKWLQGTVNKKLCVIELGVGMQYPTVIRWPFEKIVYFNQKSSLYRIHSKLYHLTEEIKDRGYSIKENPIDFLINRFV